VDSSNLFPLVTEGSQSKLTCQWLSLHNRSCVVQLFTPKQKLQP